MKILAVLAAAAFATAVSSAQQQRPDALVEEVRQLRIQFERSTLAQLAMQKVHLQQARVDQLALRIDAVREGARENPADLERRLFRENDNQIRADLEHRIQSAKSKQKHEQQLMHQLTTEQRRLDRFWADLAKIEAALSGPATPAASEARSAPQ